MIALHDPAERRLWETLGRLIDPGSLLTMDEWAEKHIQLPPDESRYSGPLRLNRTPYTVGALRAVQSPHYRRVVLCWAPQTGKTMAAQIVMAYVIDQDPGPMMLAFPDKKFARLRSRKHLRPLILSTPAVAQRIAKRQDAMTHFEYAFDRMTVNMGWAGSTSALASESIRWLIREEIDKWKHVDRTEAHPVALSELRVTAFNEIARIFDVSTPGLKSGQVWKAVEEGTHHEYFVPCPRCGKPDQISDVPLLVTDRTQDELRARLDAAGYQVLVHAGFTGFEDLTNKMEIMQQTVYRCAHCRQTFPHSAVRSISAHGRWVPRRVNVSLCSMQLARWYRDLDTCSFGACQVAFIEAKNNQVDLQNWVNGYAAEAWEERGAERSKDEIREHCRSYAWQTLPFVPLYIFATVDIRATEIHVIVRAWTHHETSALLGHYLLPRLSRPDPGSQPTGESLANLDPILEKTFSSPNGERYPVQLMGIDSAWDTDEVYEYCRSRGRCVAMKGEERMAQTMNITRPQKIWGTKDPAPDSCHLIAFQSGYYSDVLHARLNVSAGAPGDWMLPAEVGDDYVAHMIAEKKVSKVDKRTGRETWFWKNFGKPNHWRDGEKMQMVLARYLDIRSIEPERPGAPAGAAGQTDQFLGRDTTGFADRLRR